MKNKRNVIRMDLMGQDGFISLLGTLLALIIVCALGYMAFGKYFGQPVVDQKTEELLNQEGVKIKTSSPRSVLESTTARIKAIEQQQLERPDEINDMMKGNYPAGNQ